MTAEPSRPSRKPPAPVGSVRTRLGPAEAAIFETFVVPRYMSLFGELALELLVESDQARLVHLYCRTGYPDRGIALRLPGVHIVGADPSTAALQLARAKAATMPSMVAEYRAFDELPTPLPDSAFSHAMTLHPPSTDEIDAVILELGRLLAPSGQLLIAAPARGSFQELADLLREYALKYDDFELGKSVEQAALVRPTIEELTEKLEKAGFDFIEAQLRPATLSFRSGRDFFEDPVGRLLVVPELKSAHRLEDGNKVFSYVREAIDKYFSEGAFELTVNVACVAGRKG